MSESSDEQKRKSEIEKANKFRIVLKEQGAYMAEQTYQSAADFLEKYALGKNQKFVLLRPSSANQDPINTGQPDKLAWEGTHMVFSATEIDPSKNPTINQTRYLIGDDGISTLNTEDIKNEKGEFIRTIFSRDNLKPFKDLNALLEGYNKAGFTIVTVAKEKRRYHGKADIIEDRAKKHRYATFRDFNLYKSNVDEIEELKDKADSEPEALNDAEPGRPFTPMAGMAGKSKEQAEPKGPPPSSRWRSRPRR